MALVSRRATVSVLLLLSCGNDNATTVTSLEESHVCSEAYVGGRGRVVRPPRATESKGWWSADGGGMNILNKNVNFGFKNV